MSGENLTKNYALFSLTARTYRALCQWVPTSGSHIPLHAVYGGNDSTGETLYIGRSKHDEDIIPGKVVPSHQCCYVPWGGEENRYGQYEVHTFDRAIMLPEIIVHQPYIGWGLAGMFYCYSYSIFQF